MASPATNSRLDQLMPKQAATALLERLVNAVLADEPLVVNQLSALDNRSLTLLVNEIGFPLTFHVSQGHISVIANKLNDDCLIATNMQTLAKLKNLELLTSLIKSGELDIIGDVKVAQQFASIKDSLSLDWQSKLAVYIGDVPTHQTVKLVNWLASKLHFAKQQISEDASEFLLHEAKLVVSTSDVAYFNQQVTQLQQQTAQLAQRVQNAANRLIKQ
ncbi:SCP2 sterol-binding domain-containing protein [Thalassotalea ponticola]|uniref:ubiquinone biosynthesis accessory factor UbiJ n=1 Tax=Thalassotalea ponticola TaxID=1523392 RepID=UPI0025B62755|nr:SCP2 sterol-binding domain-containing protein [Thalassotalea ponticola]MDN3652387.1 SCP2 sterol-binding domain-containing protein [Thalassotalea ponticola]